MSDKREKLAKAFDEASISWKLVELNNEQADKFIDYMVDESKFLKQARIVKMRDPTKTIAKLFARGRFLHPWKRWERLTEDKRQEFWTDTLELMSKMVKWEFFITDEEKQDNIEKDWVEGHMMRIIAKKIANELEEISIYSRKIENPKDTLWMFNGYKLEAMKNGNIVDSKIWFSDRLVKKDKFKQAIKSLKTKYRGNLKYLMPSDALMDYQDLFNDSNNNKTSDDNRTSIYWKSIIEVPLMRIDNPIKDSVASTTANLKSIAGQQVLTVNSTTNFIAGQDIVVNLDEADEKVYTIESVQDSVSLTLTENLEYDVESWAKIDTCKLDWVDTFLCDPKNLIYAIQTRNMTFESERIAGIWYAFHFKMRMDFAVENPEALVLIRDLKAN